MDLTNYSDNHTGHNSKKIRGPDQKPRKRGVEHGNYKHGFGKTRDYDSLQYSKWKQAVLLKYGYACILTGHTANLQCHHLFSWYEAPTLRYDVHNGVV